MVAGGRASSSAGTTAAPRRLSVRMKPQVKVKSPDVPPALSRRVPLVKQLTSTLTKAPALPARRCAVTRHRRSDVTTIGNITIPEIFLNSSVVPVREERKVTVPRSKVKSPVNVKVVRREVGSGRKVQRSKAPRSRVEELEQVVKRKDMEVMNLTRKVNSLQKSLAEKEKAVKDLEVKIPNMLSDLKRNLEADEMKKRMNRDLRESVKRNRNLSGSMKQVEDQLKGKEDRLKIMYEEKKNLEIDLKEQQKENKEFTQKITNLEKKVIELQKKLSGVTQEREREREKRQSLEIRYNRVFDENNEKQEAIERLKGEVFHMTNVVTSREREMMEEQRQNMEMRRMLEGWERRATEEVEEDEVFEESVGAEESSEMVVEESVESSYTAPSSDTCRRLSDLDLRVDLLWSHLSARDSTTDSLVHEQASFRDSLSRMSRDLDQSTVHHSSLLHRAATVRRLFD